MTYWYGFKSDGFDGLFIVLLMSVIMVTIMSLSLASNTIQYEHTTERFTWINSQDSCDRMRLWIEIHPEAWYQDEKILRYYFLCEDKEVLEILEKIK